MLHSLEAEQALLGAVLFSNETLAHVRLTGTQFYEPAHGRIFDECLRRYRMGTLADAVTLRGWADADEAISATLGGAKYLLDLLERAAPLTSQAVGYAALIADLHQRREIVRAAEAAIADAKAPGEHDAQDVSAGLMERLWSLESDEDAGAWEDSGALAIESVLHARSGKAVGISTGIPRLDEMTGGIQPGTLWVVGGATSMGKSVMGMHLSRAIASHGYGVGEFHIEMDRTQIGLRTASALSASLDHRYEPPAYLQAQRNVLRPEQWSALEGSAKAACALPIKIDARPGRTLSQIEAGARRLQAKFKRQGIKLGAIVIDHEGLIATERGERFPSQLERTNARSERLLAMAKRLGVCVIALSQITKDGSRSDGETRLPTKHDLNYGGAISQAANVIILIHRIAYVEKMKPAQLQDPAKLRSRECTLVVDKVRGGEVGQCTVLMDMRTAAVFPNPEHARAVA